MSNYTPPSMAERIITWAVRIQIVIWAVAWLWFVSSPERHRAAVLWFDSIARGEREK